MSVETWPATAIIMPLIVTPVLSSVSVLWPTLRLIESFDSM